MIKYGKEIVGLEKMLQIGFVFYDEKGFAWHSPMCEDSEDDCCEWVQSKIPEAELWSIIRKKEAQGRTVMVMMDFAAEDITADVPGVTVLASHGNEVSLLLNKNRKHLPSEHRQFGPTDFSWYILYVVERLRNVGLEITEMVCHELW